jgi:transposase
VGLPSAAHSRRINVLGFLKSDGSCLHYFTQNHAVKADFFIECIDTLIAKQIGPTVVVVDNAGVHTSKAVKACRSRWRQKGLRLLYLPPYSPHLNPIELVWKNLKYRWLPVGAYQDFPTLCESVTNILDAYGKNYTLTFRS